MDNRFVIPFMESKIRRVADPPAMLILFCASQQECTSQSHTFIFKIFQFWDCGCLPGGVSEARREGAVGDLHPDRHTLCRAKVLRLFVRTKSGASGTSIKARQQHFHEAGTRPR